jgi:hypothetical protein
MASMTASVGEKLKTPDGSSDVRSEIYDSIIRLFDWLEINDYSGYDTFDGLNARLLRPFTFESKFLRTVLQQVVRRFPLNLRPIVWVAKERSTKGMDGISGAGLYSPAGCNWRSSLEQQSRVLP